MALYSEEPTARTESGTAAERTWTTNQWAFVGINVTALKGTKPTLVVHLEQQDANGVWHRIRSSEEVTAVGAYSFGMGPGAANGTVLVSGTKCRLAWTITGTKPVVTFQLGLQAW